MSRAPWRLVLAASALVAVLTLPPVPTTGAIAIELSLLLAVLCLAGPVARIALTAGLSLLAFQKLGDLAMRQVLGRGFDIVADLPLLPASMNLIAGGFGLPMAVGVALAAALAAAGIVWLLWRATGAWTMRGWRPRSRVTAALIAVMALTLPRTDERATGNAAYALERVQVARQTVADLRQLRQAAATDPFVGRAGLLNAIDRDLLVIFVESYGRASFDVPLYAGRHLQTLREAQTRLAGAGLAARSGFLSAPTQGGQSWLSHATFANGLWVSDQSRYRALLSSGRQSLFHLAHDAGFATAAVMPAITRPWPEARHMGFDRVLPAADLDYRGKPFNWVTMPDQFTLAATDRLLRAGRTRTQLAAQIALVSSHAPWTPIPDLLDWDRIADGTEFDAMAQAGATPREVWRDRDRVRRHYRDSVDYALRVALDYAARQGPDGPLIFLLGDHQAAPGIAMDDNRDVALHVIGPAPLVARSAAWGFAPGLVPPDGSAAIPMDRMRDLILTAFTDHEAPV